MEELRSCIANRSQRAQLRAETRFFEWRDSEQYLSLQDVDRTSQRALPSVRSGVGVCRLGRIVYCFGGYHQGHANNEMWMFHLDLNCWRQVTDAVGESPSPRTSHSVVGDPNTGLIYVICGSGSIFGQSNHGDIFQFDTFTHVWKKLSFCGDPISPRYGQSAVLYKNCIFLFGGTFGREFSNDFFRLNLETMRCDKLNLYGEFPFPRYKHSAEMIAPNLMLVFGGATLANYHLRDTFICDLDSYYWQRLHCSGDTPPGQFAHSLCAEPSDSAVKRAWLFGGCDRNRCMNDIYSFDLFTKNWNKVKANGDVPSPRYFHGAVFDPRFGELVIMFGKGAIEEHIRFNDVRKLSVSGMYELASPKCSLGDDLLNSLGTGLFVDCEVVSSDNHFFPAHSAILLSRCPHIIQFLKETMDESLEFEKRMFQLPYSWKTVCLLILFIYSDELVIPKFVQNYSELAFVILDLLKSALELESSKLIFLCQELLQFLMEYSLASRAMQELEAFHCTSAQFLRILQAYQQVDSKQHTLPCPHYRNSILKGRHSSSLGNDLIKLRKTMDQIVPCDFTIKFPEGIEETHLIVLASRCDFFRSKCLVSWMKEASTRECELSIFGPEELQVLLDYMYGGESVLNSPTARSYQFAVSVLKSDASNFLGLTNRHLDYHCMNVLNQKQKDMPGDKLFDVNQEGLFRMFQRFPGWMSTCQPRPEDSSRQFQ